MVYAFLFLLSLTCLVLYLRKRYRERQLLLIRETEQRKEKELYDISHHGYGYGASGCVHPFLIQKRKKLRVVVRDRRRPQASMRNELYLPLIEYANALDGTGFQQVLEVRVRYIDAAGD